MVVATYEPEAWNSDKDIKRVHNCYDYAMNRITRGQKSKTQPGTLAGMKKPTKEDFSCAEIERRIRADHPTMLDRASASDACPAGYHLIALAVEPGRDYHFYRRDTPTVFSRGSNVGNWSVATLWSHKPGSQMARNHDASMRLIEDPSEADRNTLTHNYKDFCGFYCMPNDKA